MDILDKVCGQFVLTKGDGSRETILLFLRYGDDIISIDLTTSAYGQELEFPRSELEMWRRVVECYSKSRTLKTQNWQDIPTLKGGTSNSNLFILHTDDEGKDFTSKMFNLTPILDFGERFDQSPLPQFLIPVAGFTKWNDKLLIIALATGVLKLRTGLHPLAYGINLEEKLNLIDILSYDLSGKRLAKTDDPEEKAARLLDDLTKNMFELISIAVPSLAHAGVSAFVYSEMQDLTEHETYEAARMCIAITEVEGNGFFKNIDKLTEEKHDEIQRRFHDLMFKNAKLNMLPRFEENYIALKKLGLVPIFSDVFVAECIFGKPKGNFKKGDRSRSFTFGKRLRKFGDAIKQKGVSGGDK